MAKKHNQWMKILTAVFTALANLFGNLKIAKKEESQEADSREERASTQSTATQSNANDRERATPEQRTWLRANSALAA